MAGDPGRPVVAVLNEIAAAGMARLADRADILPPGRTDGWHERADAVIVRATPVRRADLARAARLKVVAKHGVGVDNIDVAAARELGIAVLSTPGANAVAVAELTVGLLLAIARGIPAQSAYLSGDRAGPAPPRIGVELAGKTAGVVGLGAIGAKVAKRLLHGLDMRVLYVDPNVPQEAAPAGVVRVDDLAALLPRVDVLTLHCPLDDTTRGMIGAPELAALRRGALLVNAARGGIVDEAALHRALVQGGLRAAASDVFAVEPVPADHPLLALPNFVATPHVGAGTEEAADKVAVTVVDAVLARLAEARTR